jgi:hypothetical protein
MPLGQAQSFIPRLPVGLTIHIDWKKREIRQGVVAKIPGVTTTVKIIQLGAQTAEPRPFTFVKLSKTVWMTWKITISLRTSWNESAKAWNRFIPAQR